MKFRPSYILIVLSVIVSSPASAAPAPACSSPAITIPAAAACTSSPPRTSNGHVIRLADGRTPPAGGAPEIDMSPEPSPAPSITPSPTPEDEQMIEEEAAGTNCAAQEDAEDEVRLRAMALQEALVLLRNYRGVLDRAWETNREGAFLGALSDITMLGAGIELKLITAGVKIIELRKRADPTLESDAERIRGVIRDGAAPITPLFLEQQKHVLEGIYGEEVAESIIGALEVALILKESRERMEGQEALRESIREVDDRILTNQQKRRDLFEMWQTAKEAMDLCKERIAKGLRPDPNEYNWAQTRNYLGLGGADN